MSNSETIIFVVILLISMLFAVVMAGVKKKKIGAQLMGQAQKRNGQVQPGNWLSYPRLVLSIRGNEMKVLIVPSGKNRPPRTTAQMSMTYIGQGKLTVYRKGIFQRLMSMAGREKVETGDALFDERFSVRADEIYMATKVLTADVREKLMQLEKRRPHLRITDKRMNLTMMAMPSNEAELDLFLELATLIATRI